jgi:hypothetical protein
VKTASKTLLNSIVDSGSPCLTPKLSDSLPSAEILFRISVKPILVCSGSSVFSSLFSFPPMYFNISDFLLGCHFLLYFHCFLIYRFLRFLEVPNPSLTLHSYRYSRLHQSRYSIHQGHPPLQLLFNFPYPFPVLLSQVCRRFLLGLSCFPCILVEVPSFFIFVTFFYCP